MKPDCIIPNCPKTAPMIKLLAESSPTRELYYCPLCGSRQDTVTKLGRLGAMSQPVIAVGGAVAIAVQLFSLLHGEVTDFDGVADSPEID